MKIYLASSWRNVNYPLALHMLREAGHEVYDFRNPTGGPPGGFHWEMVDPDWRNWSAARYREALKHPIAQQGFKSDLDGMIWAEACVLLLPCGRSAHLELGWMAGRGKRTIIWANDYEQPDLMPLLADRICISQKEVLQTLEVFGCVPSQG